MKRREVIKDIAKHKIEGIENSYEIEFFINASQPLLLLTIHKQIFAFTLNVANCLNLTDTHISNLNKIISTHYENAFCILTQLSNKPPRPPDLYLNIGHRPIMLISDEHTLTLQARRWEDHRLHIINLAQNYRWEPNHNYNSRLTYV